MIDHERELAEDCFGYGSWDAPYWFLGPEQGQPKNENDALNKRHAAFKKFEKDGLTDCAVFHAEIPELRWHLENRPPLQPTWRRLILLLMAYQNKPNDNDSLRAYQRDHWGRANDETCVIELSGLPANSFKVTREREASPEKRIDHIRAMIRLHSPTFVVIYGKTTQKSWEAHPWKSEQESKSTIIEFASHPTAHGITDQCWEKLGIKLKEKCAAVGRLR